MKVQSASSFIVALALAAVMPGAVSAEITDSRPFSLRCVEEKSTGFNWVNKEWVQTNFKPSSYILSKLEPTSEPCEDFQNELSPSIERHTSMKTTGCYMLKQVGEKDSLGDVCRESWTEKNGTPILTNISCGSRLGSYRAHVDGPFAIAKTYPVFATNEEQRDSVVVSMGKCSLMTSP